MENRIKRLNQITTGWVNYFGLADAKSIMKTLDEWIRAKTKGMYMEQMEEDKNEA
ncbi:Group II intron maturase-specific domain protein [Thermoanaerobacter ethanolicus JW 200]|nr:Group II intron maturase-specific domain protein [Thermoanaerobacter ethanolicus JW 200]